MTLKVNVHIQIYEHFTDKVLHNFIKKLHYSHLSSDMLKLKYFQEKFRSIHRINADGKFARFSYLINSSNTEPTTNPELASTGI